jgi:ferredoxin-thioredoxin reductase catalytic chain
MRHDRGRDMQIVCPCIPFHREHFDAIKRCWCGLFVHKDVIDPDSLPQLSPKDVGLE